VTLTNSTSILIQDANTGATQTLASPFTDYIGAISLKFADVNGDGVQDLIVGAGVGGGPRLVILDGASSYQTVLADWMAFDESFRGGISIGTGDVNGDGITDIVVGAGAGGGPHVKIFSFANSQIVTIGEFMAYSTDFSGGVNVAVGDLDGDGRAEIVTGAGEGGGSHVRIIDGRSLATVREFFAYDGAFLSGVNVAIGDVTGDGNADIITSPGAGAGPLVRVWNGNNLQMESEFFAYDANFLGGVRVSVGHVPGHDPLAIITAPGATGGSHIRGFDSSGASLFEEFLRDANEPTGASVS